MNALFAPGAKCPRLLVVLGLALLLAGPAMLLWASRPTPLIGDDSPLMRGLAERDLKIGSRILEPEGFARPYEFSPFNRAFEHGPVRALGNPDGLLRTTLGDVDMKADPDALVRDLPEDLKAAPGDVHRTQGRALAAGPNYIMLSMEAIQRKGVARVLTDLANDGVQILGALPNAAFEVYVEASAIGRVLRNPDILYAKQMDPAEKIALDTARFPVLEKARATRATIPLEVYLRPGANAAAVTKAIGRIPRVERVAPYGIDGLGLSVDAHYTAIAKIARLQDVWRLNESRDMITMNAKNAPTVQMGSAEDGFGIRPYDVAGVDGGGIDLDPNGVSDGRRLNNGTDVVPPQIVMVTDNGLTFDTPSFSQSATVSSSTLFPIGPSHRKVHALQTPGDATAATCDATLSGAGTHGTIVASAIAAFPSQLGFFATRSGIGGPGQPRNSNMDGVARGARILFQDVATAASCTLNSLIERGGNVTPGRLLSRLTEAICPKSGGAGPCAGLTGGASEVHLAVLPFGTPNFSTNITLGSNGTYTQDSADLDTFLYNNRDFMIAVPVGNSGGLPGTNRLQLSAPQMPDLFNGSSLDECAPNVTPCQITTPRNVQISPPATAKNIISVGSHTSDCATFFGSTDCEETTDLFSSRGPATPESLRMAPILKGPSSDLIPSFDTVSVAAFRSRDNDNDANVGRVLDAELDEGNFGSSFSAAYVTGAGAIVRDYFAQGFYPTGRRDTRTGTPDRVANVSGALVKAALIAAANFGDNVTVRGQDDNERNIRRTRAMDIGEVRGGGTSFNVGVLGNSEQGYGRVVLTGVLPISNWSKSFAVNQNAVTEQPAMNLLVWDPLATGEPGINNTVAPCAAGAPCSVITHLIRVDGPLVADVNLLGGGTAKAVQASQLRIALAWMDPPSEAGTGGPLVNDLDLVLEGPGGDGCLGGVAGETSPSGATCGAGSATDNVFYDGNVYFGGRNNAITDQWSKPRPASNPALERHDYRNPQEGIHITSDPDGDGASDDSPLFVGTWRLTIRRGKGGAIPAVCSNDPNKSCVLDADCVSPGVCGSATISSPSGADPTLTLDEDQDGDGRLRPGTCSQAARFCYRDIDCAEVPPNPSGTCQGGEDTNGNGLLDLPGQTYALVVSGPVFRAASEPLPARGPQSFPASSATLDKVRYSCSDAVRLSIFDSASGAGATKSSNNTVFTVLNASGAEVDREERVSFTPIAGATTGATRSAGLPLRASGAPVPNNGLLEADTGMSIVATYTDGQRAIVSQAQAYCTPDLINAFFLTAVGSIGDQFSIGGGCDNDDSFDAGEIATYGVALINRSRVDDYGDVVATLTPGGPGAGALRVLDSPRSVGRLPGNGNNGVFFHVLVDRTAANALAVANRRVTMTLALDSLNRGVRLSRQSYTFTHAINSDRETLHYSTDHLVGGREVRDLNRNLVIDAADSLDPFLDFIVPDEDITFASLFQRVDGGTIVTNTLGEDINNNGSLDAGEDFLPNQQLDKGILASAAGPSAGDQVPWNFDSNSGGWLPFRHAGSTPSLAYPTAPIWEYRLSGLCGFQSQGGVAKYGIWHTGDADPNTPAANASTCDSYVLPADSATPRRAELVFEVLASPIIAKVNQNNDPRGFPFTVEFQRLGANLNLQTYNVYAGGGITIDNNVDTDTGNCLLCQELDSYYTRRAGGWPYTMFRFAGGYFPFGGIYPPPPYDYRSVEQRTFGPLSDPDSSIDPGHVFNGDEEGFTGFTQNTNYYSRSPIPEATADFRPFPGPGDPRPGICEGGSNAGGFCGPRCASGANAGRFCTTNADCPGSTCTSGNADCPGGTCRLSDDTQAGPSRSFDATLIGYEGGFGSVVNSNNFKENFFFWNPGRDANRWQIGIGFYVMESRGSFFQSGDYGFGVDDVVFEWDEFHPKDESQFVPPHTPACDRFASGELAGGQCATITVDRTTLWECEESVEITVEDPNAAPGTASIQVGIVTDSDNIPISTIAFASFAPNNKRYRLDAVPGNPGLFRGSVTFSNASNTPNNVFTTPGTDGQFIVYYADSRCDADGDHVLGEGSGHNLDDFVSDLDGDGVVPALDNCPFVYNPRQEEKVCSNKPDRPCLTEAECPTGGTCRGDADGFGALCDNCAFVDNPGQEDDDADGVGNVCEFDDVDGDSIPNLTDNCPDVTNIDQALPTTGQSSRGAACNTQQLDRDNDGISDRNDNCVLTYNPDQDDTDRDRLGDLCDGDCLGAQSERICDNAPATSCSSVAPCDTLHQCVGGPHPGTLCTVDTDCDVTVGGTCQDVPGICQTAARHGSAHGPGACSDRNDDGDADNVPDSVDSCPQIYNQALFPDTDRQPDRDRDGLGDACDPDGSFDDDFDGIPDDVVTFFGSITCTKVPLARVTVVKTDFRDTNGDHAGPDGIDGTTDDDVFPDTGETGRLAVTLRNRGTRPQDRLTGVSVVLTSSDPNVRCITKPSVAVGNIEPGAEVVVGSTDPSGPGFEFVGAGATCAGGSNAGNPCSASADCPGGTCTGLVTTDPTNPVRLKFCLAINSNQTLGTNTPLCFDLVGDINQSGGTASFVVGPDGIANNADDGTIVENFDLNKATGKVCNTDPTLSCTLASQCPVVSGGPTPDCIEVFTISDFFRQEVPRPDQNTTLTYVGTCNSAPLTTCTQDSDCPERTCSNSGDVCATDADCPGGTCKLYAPVCQGGAYVRGTFEPNYPAVNAIGAVACGGFDDPQTGNTGCDLDIDLPMDWHVHCPPGVSNCPNLETGTCVGGCSYRTPVGGQKALSCPNATAGPCNSLHMGAHFDLTDFLKGDTTHFRAIQAFMTPPINLTLLPRNDNDLKLSFYHITRLMDNNGVGPGNENQCVDCGDVQIRVDQDVHPNVDRWGFWDKLVPFQNVYDHKGQAFSVFSGIYCEFTPTDTGTAPPAPRTPPVHETMCFPIGVWSHCGSTIASNRVSVVDCDGPGQVDPSGVGVWVQTAFSLSNYVGQRVQIRWIGASWQFDDTSSSYFEVGPGWNTTLQDDGWWLDDIVITGAVQTQTPPPVDERASPGLPTDCPANACDPDVLGTDRGTIPRLKITDLDGDLLVDGTCSNQPNRACTTSANCVAPGTCNPPVTPVAGRPINLSAIDSDVPTCVNGTIQFQFFKNGATVQDWSSKTFFQDAPEVTATYSVKVRCSSDFACTSQTGATRDVPVYSGDGSDVIFGRKINPFEPTVGVLYDRLTQTTTLNWFGPVTPTNIRSRTNGPTTGGVGNLGGPGNNFWVNLNFNPLLTNVAPIIFPCPPSGCNYTSGPMSQMVDPNPGLGTATLYLGNSDSTSGMDISAWGCVNAGVCSGGSTPGAFCNPTSGCPGAGAVCLNLSVFVPPPAPNVNLPANPYSCPNTAAGGQRIIRQMP